MTDDEIIAVVQAHKEGKKIQWKMLHEVVGLSWMTIEHEQPIRWNFLACEYRVSPEPRKPREWWLGFDNHAYNYQYEADRTGKCTHVREVLE